MITYADMFVTEADKRTWFFDKKNPLKLKAKISWLRTSDSTAHSMISWLKDNNISVDKITHEFISWKLTVEQVTALKLTFS